MPEAGQYAEFDQYVNYQLEKTQSNIKWTDVLAASLGVATLVLAYLFVFTIFDHWMVDGGFGTVTRAVMLFAVLLAAAAWIGLQIVVPWQRQISRLYAARVIERSDPKLRSELFNLIDARTSQRRVRRDVLAAMEKRAALGLSQIDVDQAVDRRLLLRLSYALLIVVTACCLYAVLSPKRISFLRPLTLANTSVATRTAFVDIQPGDIEVIAGQQVEVTTGLRGEIPPRITLLYTSEDRSTVDEAIDMRPVEDGLRQYRGIISGDNGRGILRGLTYRIEAGDARSDDFRITVARPPSAAVEAVHYEFPPYTEIPAQIELNGNIDAIEDTSVRLTASTNLPVQSARILFSDEVDGADKAEELDPPPPLPHTRRRRSRTNRP